MDVGILTHSFFFIYNSVPLFQALAWHRTNLDMVKLYRLVRKHVEYDGRSGLLLWRYLEPLLAGKSSHQVWAWLLQAMSLLTTPQALDLLTIICRLHHILSVAVHLQIFVLHLYQLQEILKAVLAKSLTALAGTTVIHSQPTVIQLHYPHHHRHHHHQAKQVFRLTPAQNHFRRKNSIFLQYKHLTLVVQVLHPTRYLLFLLWKK